MIIDVLPPQLALWADYDQFILYKTITRAGGRIDKVPVDPVRLVPCDAHDKKYHLSATKAFEVYKKTHYLYGIAFIFTLDDPFWFLDLDKCINADGEYNDIAKSMTEVFKHSAIEKSVSGTGLHIFGWGECPDHSTQNKPLGMEFYTESRFVALTFDMIGEGNIEVDQTDNLHHILNYFPPHTMATRSEWTTTHVAGSQPIEDDTQLKTQMFQSNIAANVLGNKCGVSDLWNRNVSVLSTNYPDPAREFDNSAVDMALASHLAFWTGGNCERIEELMRESALLRDKWDRRERGQGYLRDTICKAVAGCNKFYGQTDNTPISDTPVPPPPKVESLGGDWGAHIGNPGNLGFVPIEMQKDIFKGHVYIESDHKMWVGGAQFLKPEAYKARYAGRTFITSGDGAASTKNAFEAFTGNEVVEFPKVYRSVFMPGDDLFINEDGVKCVNIYEKLDTPKRDGDASPYLEYLTKLLPDPNDREILISFMAAVVQYPGVKFQWIPLIQGCEGNGKTSITQVMAHAVGWTYTHLPSSEDLSTGGLKFNAWMQNKLLICIEELYVNSGAHDRQGVMESMKIMTNRRMEIQRKGENQVTVNTPFNTIAMTNHRDAIRATTDQRRWCHLWTAQQSAADLKRDGMGEDYFNKLYNWLEFEHGYEIMNHFLHTYEIADKFNPATDCKRAPSTTSTVHAVEHTRGVVEQEILEAIADDRPGFKGGWVSSKKLDDLLDELKVKQRVPRNKRRDIMKSLGYDWHPHLSGGRVNQVIQQEGGKPKLFIRMDGHLNVSFKEPQAILTAYCKAQGYSVEGFNVLTR